MKAASFSNPVAPSQPAQHQYLLNFSGQPHPELASPSSKVLKQLQWQLWNVKITETVLLRDHRSSCISTHLLGQPCLHMAISKPRTVGSEFMMPASSFSTFFLSLVRRCLSCLPPVPSHPMSLVALHCHSRNQF